MAAAELDVSPATGYDHRFGVALAASVVVHAGALMVSLPASRLPSFNTPMPLSVRLVQEPLAPVAELAQPARPAASRPTRTKPAPRKHEAVPRAPEPAQLPPVETVQAVPAIDEAPASAPEPPDPLPIAASPSSTQEPVALLAPVQRAPSAELLALYTKRLSEVFARYKEYPRIAEMRGWEGSVTMRLRVTSSGHLIAAELYKSSGYDALDKQAMTMVTRAGALPVPPEGAAEIPVLVPINFRLER